MSKKFIVLIAVFAVLFVTALVWNAQKMKQQEVQNQEVRVAQQQNTENTDATSWKTYKNEKYGFEMKLPGNPTKWEIVETKIPNEKSFHGSDNEVMLTFNYKLDKSILRVVDDPGFGTMDSMSIWFINIVPTKDWKDGVCDNLSGEGVVDFLCWQGAILDKNNVYIFESGRPNVQGAGALCAESSDEQKEFCEISKNFYKFPDEIKEWDFKMTK